MSWVSAVPYKTLSFSFFNKKTVLASIHWLYSDTNELRVAGCLLSELYYEYGVQEIP